MPKQVQTDLIHRYHSATVKDWFVESRLTDLWHSPAGVSLSDLVLCLLKVLNRRSLTDLRTQGQKWLHHRSSLAREPRGHFSQRVGRTQCATASPWHSHYNQLGGSCYARATAVSSSEARMEIHLQSKSTLGLRVQPSCFAAFKTGGCWGKVSHSVWGFPQLTKPAVSSWETTGAFPAANTCNCVLLLTSNLSLSCGWKLDVLHHRCLVPPAVSQPGKWIQ